MIHFTKMHGLGNDYLFVDARDRVPAHPDQLSRRMSDRHFGVGSDGLVLITRSDVADYGMRIFNADGSEAQMCGNASRCVALFVHEHGWTDQKTITLETRAGIKTLTLGRRGADDVQHVTVDMGEYDYQGEMQIPIGGTNITGHVVNMGNPHLVLFCHPQEHRPVQQLGPQLEKHPLFPKRTNVEFVKMINYQSMDMRVWERGSGETMACGTGACASVVAALETRQSGRKVQVTLPGGKLKIEITETGRVLMTGPAQTVFEGDYDESK